MIEHLASDRERCVSRWQRTAGHGRRRKGGGAAPGDSAIGCQTARKLRCALEDCFPGMRPTAASHDPARLPPRPAPLGRRPDGQARRAERPAFSPAHSVKAKMTLHRTTQTACTLCRSLSRALPSTSGAVPRARLAPVGRQAGWLGLAARRLAVTPASQRGLSSTTQMTSQIKLLNGRPAKVPTQLFINNEWASPLSLLRWMWGEPVSAQERSALRFAHLTDAYQSAGRCY